MTNRSGLVRKIRRSRLKILGWAAACASGCGQGTAFLDPSAADEGQYLLPFAAGTSSWVAQGSFGVLGVGSHTREYAVDFVMPEGTLVLAARAGEVVEVRESCPNVNCPFDPESCCGNYIRVRHADGSAAAYFHLVQGGGCVRKGDRVERGDILGFSGNTGRSMGPHLHFSVFAPPGEDGIGRFGPSDNDSMEVRFADVPGDGVPVLLGFYASQNVPGRNFCE